MRSVLFDTIGITYGPATIHRRNQVIHRILLIHMIPSRRPNDDPAVDLATGSVDQADLGVTAGRRSPTAL